MRYCLFTFNPHPSDTKEFVQELQSLLQPILSKLKKYIFVREKKGKPEEHIHLLFGSESICEKDKIKQKIENKAIKSFIKNRIKDSNTDYKHAFDYLLVENTEDQHMYYVGYVCKETDCKPITLSYTQEYITTCVEYYNSVKRNESQKIDNSWKHLKPNELHCYMEHYSVKEKLDIDNPKLIVAMKKNKVSFNQITERQMRITKQELVLAHEKDVSPYSYQAAYNDAIHDIHEDDWTYWKEQALHRQDVIDKLRNQIKDLELKLGGL